MLDANPSFPRTAQGGRLLVTLCAGPDPVGLRFLGPQQADRAGGRLTAARGPWAWPCAFACSPVLALRAPRAQHDVST